MEQVSAYECSVVGTNWTEIVNAKSSGKARAHYWRDVAESWPSIPFTAVRARRVGPAHSSPEFLRCAEYRGVTLRCGDAVRVGPGTGVIVGHNGSANFDVLFSRDSPVYPGLRLSVHPSEIAPIG